MEGLLPFKFEGKGITREWFTLENRQLARHPSQSAVGASAWDGQRRGCISPARSRGLGNRPEAGRALLRVGLSPDCPKPYRRPHRKLAAGDPRGCGGTASPGVEAPRPFPVAWASRVYPG